MTLYRALFAGDEPMLKTPDPEEVDTILTDGYTKVLDLFALMGGSPWSAFSPVPLDKEAEKEDESVALEPEREDALLRETEPFVVRLATERKTAGDRWELGDLEVTRVVISDERPPTRFDPRQMSHTIPWSLERLAWARAFTGTMEDVVERLSARVEADAAWSTPADTPGWVADTRKKLLDTLAATEGEYSTRHRGGVRR